MKQYKIEFKHLNSKVGSWDSTVVIAKNQKDAKNQAKALFPIGISIVSVKPYPGA